MILRTDFYIQWIYLMTKKLAVSITISLMLLMTIPLTAQSSIIVETIELTPHQDCAGQFITYNLDHITTVPGGDEVRMFEANGGGVAINDLDNDGDLDIVLANHAEPNTILWNESNLNFRTEKMQHGDSRAVHIVDVDGDNWLDIVFTRTKSAPNYWHNEGNQTFSLQVLAGVTKPLYSMDWADVDQDGDLDFAGATYDAGLLSDLGQDFLMSGNAGVYYYENQNGEFVETRLATNAQGLALILTDINQDTQIDLIVGNDFAVFDQSWTWQDNEWVETPFFDNTTHSTMSFDYADINNNQQLELFSTDMKPYADTPEVLSAWEPIMESMMDDPHPPNDPQLMENVLQMIDQNTYQNQATQSNIDATGWSWSGKFADFNQDGFLDLYVVNGMMETTTFAHLPNHELVEENQAFQNDGNGNFIPAPQWQLNSILSGRGMSIADLDFDGDVDIVVNNVRGVAQLFENQICEGNSVQVEIFDATTNNTRAIGAKLYLHTSEDIYQRYINSGSGYLSGNSARIHFGIPATATIQSLEIFWTNGEVSIIEGINSNSLIQITRS